MDRGADLDAKERKGNTALHIAAHHGYKETCAVLLDNGANFAAKDDNGWTALHHAAVMGQLETCALLLDRGADLNARATVYLKFDLKTYDGYSMTAYAAAYVGGGEKLVC